MYQVTLLLLLLTPCVLSVRYDVRVNPARPEITGSPYEVTIVVKLHNVTKPLGVVKIMYLVHFWLDALVVRGGNCLRGSGMIGLEKCDVKEAEFSFSMKNLTKSFDLTVFADAQTPIRSAPLEIGFTKPHNLRIYSHTVSLTKSPGELVNIGCRFTGGYNNLAYFTWYVNSSNAPSDNYELYSDDNKDKQDWHTFSYIKYGDKSNLYGRLGPGDEGSYRCKAVYDPPEVGEFFSEIFDIDVVYAPKPNWRYPTNTRFTMRINEDVQLRWNFIANPEPMHISWTRNGRKLQPGTEYTMALLTDDFGFSAILEFETSLNTFGIYRCSVDNGMGQKGEANFQVVEREMPKDNAHAMNVAAIISATLIVLAIVIAISICVYIRTQPPASAQEQGLVMIDNDQDGRFSKL